MQLVRNDESAFDGEKQDRSPYDNISRATVKAAVAWLLIATSLFAVDHTMSNLLPPGSIFVLRLAQSVGVVLGCGLLVATAFLSQRRWLGSSMLLFTFAGLLYFCGLGDLLPLPPVTHREDTVTIGSADIVPGVVVERIDPWIERPTKFVLIETEDNRKYSAEASVAPPIEGLLRGTSVKVLIPRFDRFTYSRWLLGDDDPVVRATRILIVTR